MSAKLGFEEMTARLAETISVPVRVIAHKSRGPNANGSSKPKAQLTAEELAELVPAEGETETRFGKMYKDGATARFAINQLRAANKAAGRGLKITWIDPQDGTKTLPVASKSDEGKQVDELVKATEAVEIQFVSCPKMVAGPGKQLGRPKAAEETKDEQIAREAASPVLNGEDEDILAGIGV